MSCIHEDELLDALERAFIGAELEAHLAACDSCGELRLVAGALLDDRATAMLEAPIPSAGTMWWRMRIRERQDAEATARRSLLIGQAVTVAVAVALVITFFGGEVGHAMLNLISTIRFSTPLLLASAILVTLPIAGWVAVRHSD
jgi:predicted anti-sigma-YlaC factor YlaD